MQPLLDLVQLEGLEGRFPAQLFANMLYAAAAEALAKTDRTPDVWMRLLQDAQSQHAEANQGQCIMTLQQAEKIVRQGTGTS